MKKKKGFTVLELVMTIAVIAILSGILIPSFFGFSSGAKLAADRSLVQNLNTSLSINKSEVGYSPKTMHNAILAVKKDGIQLESMVTQTDCDLLYSVKDGKFYLSTEDEVQSNPNKYDFWKIYNEVPAVEDQIYSVYLNNNTLDSDVEMQVGFDVGYNTLIPSITYERSGEDSRSVVVRTNGSDVTVNAPNDAIKHYGVSDDVVIEDISDSSYFSYGESDYVSISGGRIVIQDSAAINGLFIKSDDVIIAQTSNASTPNLARSEAVSEVVVQVTDFVGEVQAESSFEISGSSVTVDGDVEETIVNPIKDMLSTAKDEEDNRRVTKYQARIGDAVSGDDSNYYRTIQDAINQYSTATAAKKVYLIKDVTVTTPIIVNDTNAKALTHYLYLNSFTLQGDGCTPLILNTLTKAFYIYGTGILAGDSTHPCIELNSDFQVTISNATTVGAFKNNAPKQYLVISQGSHTKVGFEGTGHFRIDATGTTNAKSTTFDIDVTSRINIFRNTISKSGSTWRVKRQAKANPDYKIQGMASSSTTYAVEVYDTFEHFVQYHDYTAYMAKLLGNITDDFETDETKTLNIDSNGFEFNGSIINKSTVTLKSGAAGGAFTLSEISATGLTINSNVNVTIDSGITSSTVTIKGNNTSVTINDGTFNPISGKTTYLNLYSSYSNSLTIYGGLFKIRLYIRETGGLHSVSVCGGTYSTKAVFGTYDDYIAPGYKQGTGYTVVPA